MDDKLYETNRCEKHEIEIGPAACCFLCVMEALAERPIRTIHQIMLVGTPTK